MPKSINPFVIYAYAGPDYFCDRNAELSRLFEMFDNQRHGVLSSMRRLGKTSLIDHFHYHLRSRKNVIPVNVDVFATKDDSAFANKLIASTAMAIEASRRGFLEQAANIFRQLKPILSIDPTSGMPTISLDIRSAQEVQFSLQAWANTIGKMKVQFQITIDEFQQISHYANTVIDAELRSIAQRLKNVHFLFSGSEQHLLLDLFGHRSKPFFASVDQMHLSKLDPIVYAEFIATQFNRGKIQITDNALAEIIRWTRGHTYYTQFICNKLFSYGEKRLDIPQVERAKSEILYDREQNYLGHKALLSKNQWKVLAHVALNQSVLSTTKADFLTPLALSVSSARQATEVLLDKAFLHKKLSLDGDEISVYDVFFSRWLEMRYDSFIF